MLKCVTKPFTNKSKSCPENLSVQSQIETGCESNFEVKHFQISKVATNETTTLH